MNDYIKAFTEELTLYYIEDGIGDELIDGRDFIFKKRRRIPKIKNLERLLYINKLFNSI